jgi:WD40 repeat protein/3',5'-cyclic AMP phosphodiesterase CpdA
MQFGRNHRFGNLHLHEPDARLDTLFQRLSDDLALLEKEVGIKPELIVISGDLAEQGKKKEFEDALEFLVRLSDRLMVSRRHVVMVPGNHDINRKHCEAYFADCEAEEENPLTPYSRKWKFYEWLFKEFYKGEKGISFTVEEPWSLWELDDLHFVVAGLNSTMAESHRDDDHYGWVGERQLRWFADRLKQGKEQGWFRLGVVHHNVLRGAEADDENLRDADDLERLLASSLNLLLHGHTHNSRIGSLGFTLPILATGSTALKTEARPPEVPNQYQAIRLWPDRIERWTRRYDAEHKRWEGDTRCSEDGNDWHIEHKVKFEFVHGIFPQTVRATRQEDAAQAEAPEFMRLAVDLREPSDDFLSRVAEVCKLRYRRAEVETGRRGDLHLQYLIVSTVQGPIARIFPVGVCEQGFSEGQLEKLRTEIFAQYRAVDPNLPCEIVYGGDRASDDLIRRAAAEGVHLHSFIEFQGIIDFRSYIDRQTRKLEADAVYPPHVYVPQQFIYDVGRDRQLSDDACQTVLEWLREPLARFVLVLGDFGTGKTFLLHEVARRMPTDIPHLVPVLIELRALEKAHTLLELVAQHLAASKESLIDLEAFPYMLREGRIVLLFDGFDELAQRVTYDRAAEHFETLLQAAGGRAKVVVTSRTQHFESDQQVKTALFARAEALAGVRLARLQPFDEPHILQFLEKLLGNRDAANDRLALIRDIRDLLGLSHNPRMLGFIAKLPEEDLRAAQERTGAITSADLYRLLIDRWLTFEYERAQPRGSAPTLTIKERRLAVTAVALCLWPKLERTMRLSELTDEVRHAVDKLTEKQLDEKTAAHLIGSGTLLVRDEAGVFAFVHQSVMEWLVADDAARALNSGAQPKVLDLNKMTPLMADFFCDLAGRDKARDWALGATTSPATGVTYTKANALLVLDRMGVRTETADLAGEDLRGRDFSGHSLTGANLARADLTEARLVDANLEGADLSETVLERADLTRANLVGANLVGAKAAGAKLLGADLRDATLSRTSLRYAKLTGAQIAPTALGECDTFGAALPFATAPEPTVSSASPANSVAWGPDHILASAHDDGAIRLWNVTTGQEVRTLSGHGGGVLTVVFSPDGQLLASGGEDKTVRLWEVGSGREVGKLRGHDRGVLSVAFSPDGKRLASGGYDNTVRLWEIGRGNAVRTLVGHAGWVSSVVFSPDGQRLASGGEDNTIRLREVGSGKTVGTLSGHAGGVLTVAFSPDGQLLASGGEDKTVRLWEVVSGREVGELRGHRAHVRTVAFSPDGQQLASGGYDSTVRLWEVGSGKEVRSMLSHSAFIRSVVFSPDGQRLASGGDDETVRLWEVGSGKEVGALIGHVGGLLGVAFSPDGQRLASGGYDNTVHLWGVGRGNQLGTLWGHAGWVSSVVFSPDGQRLASGGADNTIRLWEVGSGKQVGELRGHERGVSSVAFSPDGKRLGSGGYDKTIRLWEVGSGEELGRMLGHAGWVSSVVFSPDGKWLASGSQDNTVRLWEVESGKAVGTLRGHGGLVWSVNFSPDGKRLASGGEDNMVRLWEVESGKAAGTLRGHRARVRTVAFSPDGKRLASGGDDKTIRLWKAGSGKEVGMLRGHEGAVVNVAFSPDGKRMATCGYDSTIRIWSVSTNFLLATIVSTAEGWLAFTPDGRYKGVGNLGGAFWYAISLCRFEVGELDDFLPPGTLRRLELDDPL